MKSDPGITDHPVISDLSDFNKNSGNILERLIFNNRWVIVIVCVLITLFLGHQATKLQLNASFDKMIPTGHPYIANYLKHEKDLTGLGNVVRIGVANTQGSIYDKDYLSLVQKISDEVYLIAGVDRPFMKSVWTPNVRYTVVTQEGLDAGPVIPESYDGSEESLKQLAFRIQNSGELGKLFAVNGKSSVLSVPILSTYSDGSPVDYSKLGDRLEQIREKYQDDKTKIYITGFAKIVGDLIEGLKEVVFFFFLSMLIAVAMVYWYTRCIRSTVLLVSCSLTAVIWLLGLLPTLGYSLDPYSMLVPFLVFAIGMSHGAQKMNGIMQDIGRGTHKLVAARYTFRRLFLAGLIALLADAVGFAVLLMIDIQVILELCIATSIGVAILIFTNLILLPVLLSFTGVSAEAAARSLKAEESEKDVKTLNPLWKFLGNFTQRKRAIITISGAAMIAAAAIWVGQGLKIGDLDVGAPELRPDSRYNRDVAFMTENYGASSDLFVVMIRTPEWGSANSDIMQRIDMLEWELRALPCVDSTNSLALLNRRIYVAYSEGNPKWYDLPRNQASLNNFTGMAPREIYNENWSLSTLYVYLKDHRADTLSAVVETVKNFSDNYNMNDAKFLMAAGPAGIDAATNIVVKKAWRLMILLVYGAVILLCFITFKSWRAVAVAVLPLMLTSILAEALMVSLNIGVKVATLPVVALGVGIGVDYALYLLSVVMTHLRQGASVAQAYMKALLFIGKVVMLIGVTMSAGVATWMMSSIKFQADMGIMLSFMFLWNMLGALILLPALAHFLLKPKKIST
ncbi:MAG: RND family transporter [Desulfatitalea sp.]|nr:MMPL family transporter [Desulfatitalea sp.]NNK00742.1 RND family transporter [Desulfatitalea sp.]